VKSSHLFISESLVFLEPKGINKYVELYIFPLILVCLVKDKYRMRVLENRVLRGIFEPERDGVTRRWRK
jgi:hypothetical protein